MLYLVVVSYYTINVMIQLELRRCYLHLIFFC